MFDSLKYDRYPLNLFKPAWHSHTFELSEILINIFDLILMKVDFMCEQKNMFFTNIVTKSSKNKFDNFNVNRLSPKLFSELNIYETEK